MTDCPDPEEHVHANIAIAHLRGENAKLKDELAAEQVRTNDLVADNENLRRMLAVVRGDLEAYSSVEYHAAKNRLTADVELLHDFATRCGDMLALIRSKAPL
jgi:surfactin synthase thioesterase subunit